MRLVYGSALAMALASLVPLTPSAQAQQEANRTVAGGGITVPGWQGKADGAGQVSEAKLSQEGKDLHVVDRARRSPIGILPTRRPATTPSRRRSPSRST